MKTFHLFAVLVSLPLLLGGCGEDPDEIRELERERVSFELLTGPTKKLLSDNTSYEIKDGQLTLTDFYYTSFKSSFRWAIPEKIDGHPVTVIGADSFQLDGAGASNVTTVSYTHLTLPTILLV